MILLAVFATSCEPDLILEVENQTDQTLSMRVYSQPYFDVLPHTTTKGSTATTNYPPYFVDAVNKNGQIVYSKYFSSDELKNTTLKVVIPPREENPYLSLEVENRTIYIITIYIDNAIIGDVFACSSLRNRPLPPNRDNYAIKVVMWDVVYAREHKHYPVIINKTFSLAELEKDNWKIVAVNPNINSP